MRRILNNRVYDTETAKMMIAGAQPVVDILLRVKKTINIKISHNGKKYVWKFTLSTSPTAKTQAKIADIKIIS